LSEIRQNGRRGRRQQSSPLASGGATAKVEVVRSWPSVSCTALKVSCWQSRCPRITRHEHPHVLALSVQMNFTTKE
jgi:hypothetical protein